MVVPRELRPLLARTAAFLVMCAIVHAQPDSYPTDQWFAKHVDAEPIILEPTSPQLSRVVERAEKLGFCVCSSTNRGHPALIDPIAQHYSTILARVSKLKPGSEAASKLREVLEQAIRALRGEYGEEGFVNLDAKLRAEKKPSYCLVDKRSQRSMYPLETKAARKSGTRDFVSMKGCDKSQEFAASAKARTEFVPGPWASPASEPPKAEPKPSAKLRSKPSVAESEKEKPLTATKTPGTGAPAKAPMASVEPDISSANGADESPPVDTVDEGCIAIEHLGSHPVQHIVPQLKLVLCSRGFCATPNHAIIVDGIWTSMKLLCADEWKCTVEYRLVNNLKISAGTRLRFDDRIVITPYDLRFWILVPWVIQMTQDVIALAAVALQIAIALSVVLLANVGFQIIRKEGRVVHRSGAMRGHVHLAFLTFGIPARALRKCNL